MFDNISEVKRANQLVGEFWFSEETMRFFDSQIEFFDKGTQSLIVSDKKCFDDSTRVFSVLQVSEDGTITRLASNLASFDSAEDFIENLN